MTMEQNRHIKMLKKILIGVRNFIMLLGAALFAYLSFGLMMIQGDFPQDKRSFRGEVLLGVLILGLLSLSFGIIIKKWRQFNIVFKGVAVLISGVDIYLLFCYLKWILLECIGSV
jgi:hypothetical protein